MNLKRGILACGEYILYIFVLLWIFTKGFLGHRAFWPRRRQLGPPSQREEAETSQAKENGSNITLTPAGNEQDLEANIAMPEAVNQGLSCLNTPNVPGHDVEARTLGSEVTLIATSEALASTRSLLGSGFSKDHVLPLYHTPPPQTAQIPFLVSAAQPHESSLEAEFDVLHYPQRVQHPDVAATDLSLHFEKLYGAALQEDQDLERVTAERLVFVQGLQYTENLSAHHSGQLILRQRNDNTFTLPNPDFRFPSLNSTLCIRPPKPKHSLKKGLSSPLFNPSLLTALDTPNTIISPDNDLTPPITTSLVPETLPPMTYPRPHFSGLVSGSCPSSYSSLNTRTTIETSSTNLVAPLPTLPQIPPSPSSLSSSTAQTEDIPIRLRRFPAWRCDPTRAKYVFGSLARGASSTNVISISPSVGIVVIEGVVENPAQEVGESGFEVGFESMILSMGLVPAFESTLIKVDGGGGGGSKILGQGIVVRGLEAMRSRDAVMNDVLSWVGSSSLTA